MHGALRGDQSSEQARDAWQGDRPSTGAVPQERKMHLNRARAAQNVTVAHCCHPHVCRKSYVQPWGGGGASISGQTLRNSPGGIRARLLSRHVTLTRSARNIEHCGASSFSECRRGQDMALHSPSPVLPRPNVEKCETPNKRCATHSFNGPERINLPRPRGSGRVSVEALARRRQLK